MGIVKIYNRLIVRCTYQGHSFILHDHTYDWTFDDWRCHGQVIERTITEVCLPWRPEEQLAFDEHYHWDAEQNTWRNVDAWFQ